MEYSGNRLFPSSKTFHFQNEAKCETFVVEMSFICIIIKTHFHNKSFALSLVLKVKLFGTRKSPITSVQTRLLQTASLVFGCNYRYYRYIFYFKKYISILKNKNKKSNKSLIQL